MIGTISGSWTVLEKAEEGFWKCKCRCGEEKLKSNHFLRHNKSKGCRLCQRNEEHELLLEKLIGSKVGTWKVLSYEGNTKHGSRRWKCRCKCGKEQTFSTSYLTGSYKKKATTCKSCELFEMEEKNRIVKKIPNRFWKRLQDSSKRRKISFEITKEQAEIVFEKQEGKCALTGVELYFTKLRTNYNRYTNASLDRIDSSKPYTTDNIQWLDKRINMMKNTHSQDEFIRLCKTVAENN